MDIYCKVNHYPSANGSVEFSLSQYDPKKKDESGNPVSFYGFSFPFEVWKKFKDSNVKITVEKAE